MDSAGDHRGNVIFRRSATARLIGDIRASRAAGRPVDVEAIVRANPALMPELREELDKLRRIEAARLAADGDPALEQAAARALATDTQVTRDSATRRRPSIASGPRDQTCGAAQPSAGPPSSLAESLSAAISDGPGSHIGNYKLLRQIGEGGFGTVYLAEQLQPLRRNVALKIIKLGMDTRQVIARFEAERQALAIMDHPNIARVFDGGATRDGRPFFVMELVKGDPITRYCNENRLNIAERLDLFIQVCHAVQHAHQKGVIHRDLKPSNILVSTHDGRPCAKVIDFGIAKATASRLTEKTLFTEHRALVGTPEYMSPEQAAGSLDIDTRTDIYSLGVLLYELLAGSTPFEGQELRHVAYKEIERVIRETDPPKPSTRLSASLLTIETVAGQRRTDPKKLRTVVRGELDWIVMKALEKDRARRYESASSLADDIARYSSGRAVVAAPPSAAYRARKFVRRNSRAFAMAAAGSLMLLIAIAAVTRYALQQRRLAKDQQSLAESRNVFLNEKDQTLRRLQDLQVRTNADLYHALLRHAEAVRLGRLPGYRPIAWADLRQAFALDTAARNPADIQREVLAGLGDPIALPSIKDPLIARSNRAALPAAFQPYFLNRSPGPIATAPDGKMVAFVDGLTIHLLGEGGRMLGSTSLPPKLDGIYDMEFDSNSRILAVGCYVGFTVLSVPDLRPLAVQPGPPCQSVACQPHGGLLAFTGHGITLWSVHANRPVALLPQVSGQNSVAFSDDGQFVLDLQRNRIVAAWPARDSPERLQLSGHSGGVTSVAFSPDGRRLASASKDQQVKLWDSVSGRLLHTLNGHTTSIQAVAFSPDGLLLATGDFSGVIRFWDPESGDAIGNFQTGIGSLWQMGFEPRGKYLAACGTRGAGAWVVGQDRHLANARPLLSLWSSSGVTEIAIHPSGEELALSTRGRIYACELLQGRLRVLAGSQPYAAFSGSMHFDSTGTEIWFRSSSNHFAVAKWLDGGKPRETVDSMWFISPSPDRRWLAMAGEAPSIAIYNLRSLGSPWAVLPQLEGGIWSLAFSPGGDKLAVGQSDGGLAIWKLDEVRSRLGEFGIPVESTAAKPATRPVTPGISDAELSQFADAVKSRENDFRYPSVSLELALTEYDDRIVAQPENEYIWYQRACMRLYAGHVEQYRGECRQMLDHFKGSNNPTVVDQTAKACLLDPDPVGDPVTLTRLADYALSKDPNNPWFLMTKGLALYRSGNYSDSVTWLEQSRDRFNGSMWTGVDYFLALSYFRLGQREQARQLLNRAIEELNARGVVSPSKVESEAGGIENWVVYQLARREAEKLIVN
jgi:serine/threonine protein kinase/WD40 repeat protein